MNSLTKVFGKLDLTNKIDLLRLGMALPTTKLLKKDIKKSPKINNKNQSVLIKYKCNKKCNFGKIYRKISKNPLFLQIDFRLILTDLLKIIDENQERFSVKQLDYMLFQKTKMPKLYLKNITKMNIKVYSGVSNFTEINNLRSNSITIIIENDHLKLL